MKGILNYLNALMVKKTDTILKSEPLRSYVT